MKIFVVAFVVSGLVLGVFSKDDTCSKKTVSNDPCGLTGKWKNELGSMAVFTCADGQLNGKYNSDVGEATDFYDLSGRYTMSGPYGDVTVAGWTVAWNNTVRGNSNSTTSWTGLYYPAKKVMFTQYILVSYVDVPNLWQSSLIYHDEFKKISECDDL